MNDMPDLLYLRSVHRFVPINVTSRQVSRFAFFMSENEEPGSSVSELFVFEYNGKLSPAIFPKNKIR